VFTGLRFIASRPLLEALSWQMVLATVFAGAFFPILSVYARDVLGTGAAGYGALTSAIGVGAAIGAIAMGAVGSRFRRGRAATVGAMVFSVMVVLLSLTWSLPIALALLAMGGAAMAAQGIATATALQLASPNEVRGKVMAVYSFVVLGLAPFGAFQAGLLAEHFGAPWSIGLNGAACLIGTLVLHRRLWEGKE
jgi:MFS family permease